MIRIASAALCMLLATGVGADAGQHQERSRRSHSPRVRHAQPIDKQALATQVMLDRAGYSPGEIDAQRGTSTERALAAYTKNGGATAASPENSLTDYTITEQDTAGPFTPSIPHDMMEMAKLPALGYTNVIELLGERFHASPTLVKRLNPEATFAAGEVIQLPNVRVSPVVEIGTGNSRNAPVTVTVRKSTSDLVVTDASGAVLMYAPVTTGSEHDPLPIGDWKVTGIQRNPTFHYNPALFWDAQSTDSKATIQPGPNNPVGVVWIDLSRPHYGLHGTPEPSTVGKTASHGCVRLTNWDATKLASLVRPGTPVVFAE